MRTTTLLTLSLFVSGLTAQSFYVPADTPGTGTANAFPFNTSDMRYQALVLASELGSTPAMIRGFALAPSANGTLAYAQVTMKMAHLASPTLSTDFATNLAAGATTTMDQPNWVWPVTGNVWNQVDMQTPFFFNGVDNVVVVDLIGSRLEKALEVGADAVVNAAGEDVAARLTELHGPGKAMWPGKAGTDIYLDCAGTPAVIDGVLRAAQNGARLGVVAVHKEPVAIDLVNLMANEITVIGSMGYPTEIFEVTRDLAANWEKYAVIVSHTFGFDDVQEALVTARTPGAADKVVVTFD